MTSGKVITRKGELPKSETYYQKSKALFEKIDDAEGIAKSSRALAKVQEDLNKNKDAIGNYTTAQANNFKTGDINANKLNGNDIDRLLRPDSAKIQERLLQKNINLGISSKDTSEIVSGYSRMGNINLKNNKPTIARDAFNNAYKFSKNFLNRPCSSISALPMFTWARRIFRRPSKQKKEY
ncbi:MAG: tetratricopeptide repeat protein [Bacteroidota bacterium]